MKLVPVSSSDRPAAVVYVESGHGSDLAFSLRVQDISRQSQTWGTDIPVVRENELRTRTITLLDVPVTAAFRNTIRIYDVDGRQGAEVRVRLFGLDPKQIGIGIPAQPDELLGEKVIALRPPLAAESATSPGYLEIGDLSLIAPLGEWRRVLIEIEPLIVGLRLWAFVSVTNNDTQHVTVITPQ